MDSKGNGRRSLSILDDYDSSDKEKEDEDSGSIYNVGSSVSARGSTGEVDQADASDFESAGMNGDVPHPPMSPQENGSEIEEERRVIQQLLSSLPEPKVTDIESRRAVIVLSPPEYDQMYINPGEFFYKLFLCERGGDSKYKLVYSGDATVITFKDLKPAIEYHLKVIANLGDVKGTETEPISFKTCSCEPDRPQCPKLQHRTKTSISLNWSSVCENGSKITAYVLEYDQGEGSNVFVEVYSGLQRQYRVPKLAASTKYTFRLCIVNGVGRSDYSEHVTLCTCGSPPSQPDPPMMSEVFVNSFIISWIKRPNDDEFQLQLEDESSGHGFMPVYNGQNLSSKVNQLRRNKEYKFRLAAKNEEGISKWSEVIAYRTLPGQPEQPAKPQIKGKVHAHSWDPQRDDGGSEITKYIVELDDGKGPALPIEILRMDGKAIKLYKTALEEGEEVDHSIRIMIIGHFGVGKTTLARRLLGEPVDLQARDSTNGIDVHIFQCKVSSSDLTWLSLQPDEKSNTARKRLAKVIANRSTGEEDAPTPAVVEILKTTAAKTESSVGAVGGAKQIVDVQERPVQFIRKLEDVEVGEIPGKAVFECELSKPVPVKWFRDNTLLSPSNKYKMIVEGTVHSLEISDVDGEDVGNYCVIAAGQKSEASIFVGGDEMLNSGEKLETQSISKPSDDKEKEKEEEDEDTASFIEMKALVESGTLEPGEFTSFTLWDFAGQYVFYTTHQMFLSPRSVYLLVTDISKHIGDVVMDDECYFDSSGPKQCTISEYIDFWLNSIHTCSSDDPCDESKVPPVILVGTHADKLTKATVTDDGDSCQMEENCNRNKLASAYFEAVRNHLSEKPTQFHLADEDFDIDNTVKDSKLNDLKKKIVEVAQRQPHWGTRIPAKWLPLEAALYGLKEKIVDFVRIEELNDAMSVPISTAEELELFLQFHHQSGNILYFSEGSLKEKVVLDPQWLVNALKSLITANMFYSKIPHVMQKWREFSRNGILRPQLLDAVWHKEKNPSFHDNRAHLLALMEKLNLISRPMLWHKDDATPTKEEYHLAPCMLKEKPPEVILSPCHGEDCETTSILVFYFKRKFLSPAIFHRLLAACLSKWPLWRQGERDGIFCGCGVFEIDQSHKLTLFVRDFTIQAFVTKFGRLEKSPREETCIDVRDFLDNSLTFFTGCIATSSLYKLCIKCPENKSNSVDAIIPVSKLQEEKEVVCSCHDSTYTHVINSVDMLKYWFPCKPDSVTAPLNTGYIPGGYDEIDTVPTTGHDPGSATSFAGDLKTEHDNNIAEDIHDAINRSLKSVGRLWLPNSSGTAFRVGSKYAMTNWHVIRGCVDPLNNGQREFYNLERSEAYITFSVGPCLPIQKIFYISSTVPYFDVQLDIAVVELKTDNPPPALPLCTEPEECKNVNKLKVLGFGHPESDKKTEECATVIPPESPRVMKAQAWVKQKEKKLKSKCRAMGKDPESFTWDYRGWDDDKNVAIDLYKEKGSSGSPALLCDDATKVKVMAVVYRGLPDCFWELPSSLRLAFPTYCRIELAVKMSHIYVSMQNKNPTLTNDVFQCGEVDMELKYM